MKMPFRRICWSEILRESLRRRGIARITWKRSVEREAEQTGRSWTGQGGRTGSDGGFRDGSMLQTGVKGLGLFLRTNIVF